MSVKTLYPHTLSQYNEETSFAEFRNLNNVKNNQNTFAKTTTVGAITNKKPATVLATNFKANIPAGAKINKVTVQYAAGYEGNISISKSIVNLVHVVPGNSVKIYNDSVSKFGKALTKTVSQSAVTFDGSKIALSRLNAENFGVMIAFPENTKRDVGFVKLKYIRIVIDYSLPNFKITASSLSNKKPTHMYTNENIPIQIILSHDGKTKNAPTVSFNIPEGVSSVQKLEGDGTLTISGSIGIWNPGTLSDKNLFRSIIIETTITTDGNHIFVFSENLSNDSRTLNVKTVPRPTGGDVTEEEDTKVPHVIDDIISQSPPLGNIRNYNGYPTVISIDLRGTESPNAIYAQSSIVGLEILDPSLSYLDWEYDEGEYDPEEVIYTFESTSGTPLSGGKFLISDGVLYLIVGNPTSCKGTLALAFEDEYTGDIIYEGSFNLEFLPKEEDLTVPFLSIIRLSEEECNRLGNGIVYTVQSWFKLISSDAYIRDWYKNFRIGVFNNINPNVDTSTVVTESEIEGGDEISIDPTETSIDDDTDYDNLTFEEIFEYAEYWGNCVSNVNAFESITVDFPYNENYPVYIIIAGDYPEGSPNENDIHFTEPCIIESSIYSGPEINGNFPIPILNLIGSESLAEVNLKLFEQGNSFIIYDFPLDEGFGVNDVLAISGIEVTGNVEFADQVVLSAKLRHPDGRVGERSIIVDSDDDRFSIGGKYDLWGFNMSEMINLNDWEVEFALNNIFDNENSTAEMQINNIQVAIFIMRVKSNAIKVYVEGENVRHYGMFVTKAKVPEGLKTEVKSANIDGCDETNPYRMNVQSKEIELEFSIRGCTLEETTELLRQVARLFVNERDELNRPILKKLELSNYPDVYFEYLMEDPFDNDVQVTDYTSKVKLVVPSGTAFSKEDTVSNTTGRNNGIAKVKPKITFIPTGDSVEITETISNQTLKINYSDWDSSNTVEIDCINRKITLFRENSETGILEEEDITESRDYISDWFVINNEYAFEGENCIIQTVQFTERW